MKIEDTIYVLKKDKNKEQYRVIRTFPVDKFNYAEVERINKIDLEENGRMTYYVEVKNLKELNQESNLIFGIDFFKKKGN